MAKTLTMKEYNTQKAKFFGKHSGERGGRESSSIDGEIIRKTICFEDGHAWDEVTEPVLETVEVEMHGMTVQATVKFYRTEIWDSEDGVSRYLYEKAWDAA